VKKWIFGCIRRKIAKLRQLKQVRYKRDARRYALPEQSKGFGQKHKPADQIGCGQHNQERRKYPPNSAPVKLHRREAAGRDLRENDAGDQEAGDNEKHVNPDKSAGNELRMISDH
jgi:hypothetical protein